MSRCGTRSAVRCVPLVAKANICHPHGTTTIDARQERGIRGISREHTPRPAAYNCHFHFLQIPRMKYLTHAVRNLNTSEMQRGGNPLPSAPMILELLVIGHTQDWRKHLVGSRSPSARCFTSAHGLRRRSLSYSDSLVSQRSTPGASGCGALRHR